MGKKMGETIHVGRRIKERVAQMPELTAKALASKMNMHEQTLYDVYRRSSVDTDKLLMFSEILKVPLTYFFSPYDDGKDNKTPPVKTETSAASTSGASSIYASASPRSASSAAPVRTVSEPVSSGAFAPVPPLKSEEAALLRQELEKLTLAFNEFCRTVETKISDLQRQMDELKTRFGGEENQTDEKLRAVQEQRIRELEALNEERSLLLQALLKRHL